MDLLFLPQSFIKADSAGRPNFTMHEIDAHDLEDLSLIIDRLLKNKVKIVSFSDIVKEVFFSTTMQKRVIILPLSDVTIIIVCWYLPLDCIVCYKMPIREGFWYKCLNDS